MARAGVAEGKADQRKLNINHVAGEVFRFVETPSDNSVLWGELWKEPERQLMKHEMQTALLRLVLKECYFIVSRTIWQPEVRVTMGAAIRSGPCAVLLHSLERKSCTGWQWMKLARPLYNRGFSVVSLDFPGFGGSTMNKNLDVEVSKWRRRGHKLITESMLELSVRQFCMVAEGEACEFVVELLRSESHRLDEPGRRRHVFHNPVLDLDRLFPTPHTRPERGQQHDEWRRTVLEGQLSDFERVVRKAEAKIVITFDEQTASQNALQTLSYLWELKNMTERMGSSIIIEYVSREEICEAQAGSTVSTRVLVLSRWLRESMADFLIGTTPGLGVDPSEQVVQHSRTMEVTRRQGSRGLARPASQTSSRAPSNHSGGALHKSSSSSALAALAVTPATTFGYSAGFGVTMGSRRSKGTESRSDAQMPLTAWEERSRSCTPPQQSRNQLALPAPQVMRSSSLPASAGGHSRKVSSLSPSNFGDAATTYHMATSVREAGQYTANDLSATQQYLKAPQMFRLKMLSKVPRAMQPPQTDVQWSLEAAGPDVPAAEARDLEDGVDASLRMFLADQAKLAKPSPSAEYSDLNKSRSPQRRRQMWKAVNKDMRKTMTFMRSLKSGKATMMLD